MRTKVDHATERVVLAVELLQGALAILGGASRYLENDGLGPHQSRPSTSEASRVVASPPRNCLRLHSSAPSIPEADRLDAVAVLRKFLDGHLRQSVEGKSSGADVRDQERAVLHQVRHDGRVGDVLQYRLLLVQRSRRQRDAVHGLQRLA